MQRLLLSLKSGLFAVPALLLLLFFSTSGSGNLLGGDEPLAPEVAFIPTLGSVDGQSIQVQFQIEPGYYLYRDKLKFSVTEIIENGSSLNKGGVASILNSTILENEPGNSEPAGKQQDSVALGKPQFSESVVISDDYFGEQAVFRESALIYLPYTAGRKVTAFSLNVRYQGCADIGLCYPPIDTSLTVEIPPAVEQSPASSALPSSTAEPPGQLGELLNSDRADNELLPPELAYLPQIVSATNTQIDVRWEIEDGYYLYRDKLSFTLQPANTLQIGESHISNGVMQYDDFFGNVEILRQTASATLAVSGNMTASGTQDASLLISYQGCADIGVCFPPSVTALPLSFTSSPTVNAVAAAGAETDSGNDGVPVMSANANPAVTGTQRVSSDLPAQSEQDRLFGKLSSDSLWLTVATFFGFGLLLAFTPCVLPMVPILSSLIVGQGKSMSTAKAFQLSLVYVLVMATTYAMVGVFVGLSGYNVQAFLQNPWVLSAIALLFVGLSLSMFGFYELRMPAGLQDRLTQWSNRQNGGQVTGVAAMGFVSTLIVGPCVTAPLAGALIYIARTGDALIGGAALFALGLGMGAPLLLIGTSAGKLLPRAGTWMNTVNHVFGILMLAMAIYMVSRFLPSTVTMSLYGILAIMSGVYLGATDSLSHNSNGWHRFSKGGGIVVSLYGVTLLIGALSGGGSYTTPLRGLVAGGTQTVNDGTEHALPFQAIKGVDGLQQAVARAQSEGRALMLDFYADWCISCKEMEAFTFTDSRVQALLKNAVVVQADVTDNDKADQALLKKFDLFGPPGIIFYNADGQELPSARVVGFMNADNFSAHIERAIGSVGPLVSSDAVLPQLD